MSLAEQFRFLGDFLPGYGVCGGSSRDCAIRREDLDPLDQLFFDHDAIKYATTPEDREAFDQALYEGIRNLKEKDFQKIPAWVWKWPFFKRRYAMKFAAACLVGFK
jgi:hypothetical protein